MVSGQGLGRLRDKVSMRKTEAPGLTGMLNQVAVKNGKECTFDLSESSRAQHEDQCVAARRWGLDSVESRSKGKGD
jgi:hypothetical protein